jgi:hypothetical protein
MIQEGYEKVRNVTSWRYLPFVNFLACEQYHGNAFKVPMMTRWMVIISGQDRVNELGRAAPNVVSFKESLNQVFF